ncbi:hypothetical protein [Pimelobacter sp. 30-1]|uniref:hypothetical protein n=1 Tax=Pimelobacter sp. 30-1 TaxID=2004991 RepID=UPI001C053202|nr:hypothetical protein [Pimelobacter sp. 30-1]
MSTPTSGTASAAGRTRERGDRLDDLLFDPAAWFAINADNQRIPRLVVPTLDRGLELVDTGDVATIVGRLRPDIAVVDVDLAGYRGHQVSNAIASWCTSRGLWHLLRPSGGEDGRTHVFVHTAAAEDLDGPDGLAALVTELRASLRASAKAIDLRRSGHIRPLSAPHRTGAVTRPHGDLRAAGRRLMTARRAARAAQPLLEATSTSPSTSTPAASLPASATAPDRVRSEHRRGRSSARTSRSSRGAVTALAPRPRTLRPLPEAWARYLATGQLPAIGGTDHSRSTYEAIATKQLLRAGHSAESAWAAITAAHSAAMTRARGNRRRWTAWVWNPAVDDDNAQPPPSPARPSASAATEASSASSRSVVLDCSPEVATAVSQARQRITALAWTLPVRQRPAVLLVGHHVLDRMERDNSTSIPVPERDLVLDTGLGDRKTIRRCLRALSGPGSTDAPAVGQLDASAFDTANRASSSFEFSIPTDNDAPSPAGVRQIPPPRCHTPLPRGTWSPLPASAHSLWRALDPDQPYTVDEVAHRSTLQPDKAARLTPSQRRSTTGLLRRLAAAGLASCTPAGWVQGASPTPEHLRTAARRHAELQHQVTAERQAYRAAATSTWSLQRSRALHADRERHRTWWTRLAPDERRRRSAQWASTFHALSVDDQERTKTRLATTRIAAGGNEQARHRAWTLDQPPDRFRRRSLQRQAWYDGLAPQLQAAHVAAWTRHRDRFGLPRAAQILLERPDRVAHHLLPDGAERRDQEHLDRQHQPDHPGQNDQVLFEPPQIAG